MDGKENGTLQLAGTVVVAIVTTIVIAAGYVGLWITLVSRLPLIVGIPAMVGLIGAPFQLVIDLLNLDRAEGKNLHADLDRTRLQPASDSGADARDKSGTAALHEPIPGP